MFATTLLSLFLYPTCVTNIDPATFFQSISEMKVESKTEANDEENIPVVICGVSFQDRLSKSHWSNKPSVNLIGQPMRMIMITIQSPWEGRDSS